MKKNSRNGIRTEGKGQRKSYLNLYRQKNQVGHKTLLNSSIKNPVKWSKQQISQRRDKIIETIYKENDVSRMRIQQQSMESQFMKDDYLDLELMWFKKIDEIKEQTHKLRSINIKEAKIVRSLEQEHNNLKFKLKELSDKCEDPNRNSQETGISEDFQYAEFQKQYFKKAIDQQNQIKQLQNDRQEILMQNCQLEESINKIQISISEQAKNNNNLEDRATLKSMQLKRQRLQNEIKNLQSQNRQIQLQLQKVSKEKLIYNEYPTEFLQIAEKVFIINELQKLQQLMQVKQNQIMRAQMFDRNRQFYNSKSKQIQVLEFKVRQKQQLVYKLTEQIKQRSIDMLNLYTY